MGSLSPPFHFVTGHTKLSANEVLLKMKARSDRALIREKLLYDRAMRHKHARNALKVRFYQAHWAAKGWVRELSHARRAAGEQEEVHLVLDVEHAVPMASVAHSIGDEPIASLVDFERKLDRSSISISDHMRFLKRFLELGKIVGEEDSEEDTPVLGGSVIPALPAEEYRWEDTATSSSEGRGVASFRSRIDPERYLDIMKSPGVAPTGGRERSFAVAGHEIVFCAGRQVCLGVECENNGGNLTADGSVWIGRSAILFFNQTRCPLCACRLLEEDETIVRDAYCHTTIIPTRTIFLNRPLMSGHLGTRTLSAKKICEQFHVVGSQEFVWSYVLPMLGNHANAQLVGGLPMGLIFINHADDMRIHDSSSHFLV